MTKTIIFMDTGKDLDDEESIILLKDLIKNKLIDVLGIVVCLYPVKKRAILTKGLLDSINLKIPVYIGSDIKDIPVQEYEFSAPYYNENNENFDNAESFLKDAFLKYNKINIIVQSGFTDLAFFISKNKDLFLSKINKMNLMSGLKNKENFPLKNNKNYFVPDNSNNNVFDLNSTNIVFEVIQKYKIRTIITNRNAVYNTNIPLEILKTEHPIIQNSLFERKYFSYYSLWKDAISEKKILLPSDRDKRWFLKNFCNTNNQKIDDFQEAFSLIKNIYMYDPINMLSAIEDYYIDMFSPLNINEHISIIGVNSILHGIKREDKILNTIKSSFDNV